MSTPGDRRKLVDGFTSLPGGMDASRFPNLIAGECVHKAINTTFRGGHPHCRPPLMQTKIPDVIASWSNWREQIFHGAKVYVNPATRSSLIIIAAGKYIVAADPAQLTVQLLASDQAEGPEAKAYFCQAGRYLVIQNGINLPYVFDGETMKRATEYDAEFPVPIGTIMAYGQGRLFVAIKDRTQIIACDLVYGGQLVFRRIVSSSVAEDSVITVARPHGAKPGDTITIEGHSSSPDINGTYLVKSTPTDTTFTVGVEVTTAGAGGSYLKAVAGQESDLLHATETTFLAEGYPLALPAELGRIVGMEFVPNQDTASGQGDLLVSGENGTGTFMVSAPRADWKNISFYRVLLPNAAAAGPEAFVHMNSDLMFGATDGIRSYRSARAEWNSYGLTPLSGEVSPFMEQQTKRLLYDISAIKHDDRLLLTVAPQELADSEGRTIGTYFKGIVALDFSSTKMNAGKTISAYDGVWTGLKVLQLIEGPFSGERRGFVVAQDTADAGGKIELWELKKNGIADGRVTSGGPEFRKIDWILETKAFDFQQPLLLKKLIRGDFWFGDVYGKLLVKIFFKADGAPEWVPWAQLTLGESEFRTFSLEGAACVYPAYQTGPCGVRQPVPGYFPQIKVPVPEENVYTSGPRYNYLGNEFQVRIEFTGYGRLLKGILYALDQVEDVSGSNPSNVIIQDVSACNRAYFDYSAT